MEGIAPSLIFLLLFVAIFYVFLIRPQRRRQQRHHQLVEGLNKGDRIITAGGIYGEIVRIGKRSVVLKLEDGAKLRLAKDSITEVQERD
ncbi:MAG: preprotein translocase subunit YajC [Candidatus Bipolaricaulia bacterium]